MTALILDGREVAAALRSDVAERVARLRDRGRAVGLATVLIGDHPASLTYVRNKHHAAEAVGMASFDHHLPDTVTQEDVESVVDELNRDDAVSGMIVQLPLPAGLDVERIVERVDPAKDADGLHPFNLGRLLMGRPGPVPATPGGIMRILEYYGIDSAAKTAVIVGRSFLVGRPMALLLGAKGVDATVVQAHSRTPDLADTCSRADVLVAAVGRPNLIGPEHVKPGATVIDVGISRTDAGLVGDVDFDSVVEVAGAITPVPGGVGPMTVASLLANTIALAERQARVT